MPISAPMALKRVRAEDDEHATDPSPSTSDGPTDHKSLGKSSARSPQHPSAERVSKGERRRQRDLMRRINGWQQYRALWDGIDFKRQILNMGDKKVRFALVIMGALNAVLLFVLARDPMLRHMPPAVRVGMAAILVIYGVATFRFMAHAIEALRPAPEARKDDALEWEKREVMRVAGDTTQTIGLMIRGPLQQVSFSEEQHAWSHARLADINAELILFNRASSYLITHQHEQLRKVYQDLKVLVLLGAAVLLLTVAAGIWRGEGASPSQAGILRGAALGVVGGH